jgi:hypothetical protein
MGLEVKVYDSGIFPHNLGSRVYRSRCTMQDSFRVYYARRSCLLAVSILADWLLVIWPKF